MPTVTYTAHYDLSGEYLPVEAVRCCVVVRRVDGKFGWVCGRFATMKAARKRARVDCERAHTRYTPTVVENPNQ